MGRPGKPPLQRHVIFEIYPRINCRLKTREFEGGTVGTLFAKSQRTSRLADEGSTKFLYKLSQRERPAWEQSVLNEITRGQVFTYEGPSSMDNMTGIQVENPDGGEPAVLTAPIYPLADGRETAL